MGSKVNLYEKFTARIILSRKSFFGFNDTIIKLWITFNFKIIQIKSINFDLKNIPFTQNSLLDIKILKKWCIENNLSINFTTKNSFLKRNLFGELEDVMIERNIPKKKYKNQFS